MSEQEINLRLATSQVIVMLGTLVATASSVIISVWVTTRDLSRQIEIMYQSINELSITIESQEERIRTVELQAAVTEEIQRRLAEALPESIANEMGKKLRR